MPVRLVCTCGTEIAVDRTRIGGDVRCPKCKAVTSTTLPAGGATRASTSRLRLKQATSTRVARISEPTRRYPAPGKRLKRRLKWIAAIVLGAAAAAAVWMAVA